MAKEHSPGTTGYSNIRAGGRKISNMGKEAMLIRKGRSFTVSGRWGHHRQSIQLSVVIWLVWTDAILPEVLS